MSRSSSPPADEYVDKIAFMTPPSNASRRYRYAIYHRLFQRMREIKSSTPLNITIEAALLWAGRTYSGVGSSADDKRSCRQYDSDELFASISPSPPGV